MSLLATCAIIVALSHRAGTHCHVVRSVCNVLLSCCRLMVFLTSYAVDSAWSCRSVTVLRCGIAFSQCRLFVNGLFSCLHCEWRKWHRDVALSPVGLQPLTPLTVQSYTIVALWPGSTLTKLCSGCQ